MNDESAEESRRECPEWGCTIEMRPDELRKHLEWDHNRWESEIERLMDDDNVDVKRRVDPDEDVPRVIRDD